MNLNRLPLSFAHKGGIPGDVFDSVAVPDATLRICPPETSALPAPPACRTDTFERPPVA